MKLEQAMSWCKVRGYIARLSKPDKKYWKIQPSFETLETDLPHEDRTAEDWKTFDPEADENPLTA